MDERNQNPFAPPSATAEGAEDGGLVFSPEGARVVSSLATWMRALSVFYIIIAALLVLGTCGVVVGSDSAPAAIGGGVAMILLVVLIGLAGQWLRSAGEGFERGVFSDDEFPIGQGFRNLRAYLILVGLLSIFSLVTTVLEALGVL